MPKWFKNSLQVNNTRMKFVRNTLFLLFAVSLLYSCSGGFKNEPKLYHVQIKDMKFQPAELIVDKGDTVEWTNMDITDHDVTEDAPNGWASAPMATGKSWKTVIEKNTNYHCNIHKVMKGSVTLE